MKFLFYLGHPAHYHNISIIIDNLNEKGHDILLVVRPKDILSQLIQDKPHNKIYVTEKKGKSKISLIYTVLAREAKLLTIAFKYRPHLLIGTDIVITHVGRMLNIPSIVINEDDFDAVPFFSKLGYPWASSILAPESCKTGKWKYKTINYSGYHELAYLHPKYFHPDKINMLKYVDLSKPFYIFRFAELTAHHDKRKTGIDFHMAQRLIKLLRQHGNIYITSERQLEPEFEQYRIQINPIHIHHALYYATIYIGDSQTMTAEAAVLGTPALRFNDFVGKLGYLEELEHKYGLTCGIKTSEPKKLFQKAEELVNTPRLREEWQGRRKKMLSEKIDVTAFMVWFFENYPDSITTMTENPDYQYRFK